MRKIQNGLFDVILFTMILHTIFLFLEIFELYNILNCTHRNSVWYVCQFYLFILFIHTEAKLGNFMLTWIIYEFILFSKDSGSLFNPRSLTKIPMNHMIRKRRFCENTMCFFSLCAYLSGLYSNTVWVKLIRLLEIWS